MKNTLKFISIGFALVLLVMSQQMNSSQPAEAALAEDAVKFQSIGGASGEDPDALAKGATVKFYSAGAGASDVAKFFIKDSDLNAVQSGRSFVVAEDNGTGAGEAANGQLEAGEIAAGTGIAAATVISLVQDMDDSDAAPVANAVVVEENSLYDGSNTPIVPGTLSVSLAQWVDATAANCGGGAGEPGAQNNSGPFVSGTTACYVDPAVGVTILPSRYDVFNETTGQISFTDTQVINDASGGALVASYSFNVKDDKARANTTGGLRRAKVTSTSDSVGEYITIQEAVGEGNFCDSHDSSFFYGAVAFDTSAAAAARDTVRTEAINEDCSGGAENISVPTVWVQDGDTITVDFLGTCTTDTNNVCTGDGTIISSATATIDATVPTISNISPADGTLTSDTSPTLSFTISDLGSGFSSTMSNYVDHVDLIINSCGVVEGTELSVSSHTSTEITFTYDLAGTTKFTDDATTDAGGTLAANTTTAGLKFCNTNDGAATDRDQTNSGFFIIGSTRQVEDGTGDTVDNDRTIHGIDFQWSITATDEVGNVKTVSGTDMDLTIDDTAPSGNGASAVTTGKAWNSTKLADEDDQSSIKIEFTETVDRNTVSVEDFVVSGTGVTDTTISSVSFGGTQGATDTFVYLKMAADLAPNAKPKVELQGQISDLAGNVYKVAATDTDGLDTIDTGSDTIKPTVSGVAIDDTYLDDLETATVTWTSDENQVDSAGAAQACTCVYVYGGFEVQITDAVANNARNSTHKGATLVTPTSGKVELKNGTANDGLNFTKGLFGVQIAAKDGAATPNIGIGGITKVTEDVSKYFLTALAHAGGFDPADVDDERSVKLSNWPIADHDGDGDLSDSITAWTDDGNAEDIAHIKITNVDWSENESIDVEIGNAAGAIAAGSVVKFTYYYINSENLIEMDETAPSLAVTPTNDATTENLRQRITLTFDEDEYGGDTHLTTTVTKATLTDPAGTEVDILSSLITSDNKSYYYKPGADLDYGQYTVKVKAEDANANAMSEATSKFTVNERSKTTVAMQAGWNLISMPGTPSDTAINTVIDNEEVTTVLTYDPAVPGGWLTAVRDGASLVGTLTTIDASRGYWVYQEDGDDIKTLIPGSSSGVQQVPPAIALVKGWNLVPMVTLNLSASNIEADTYFANIDWNKAKGWNAGTEQWFDVLKGVDVTDADEDGTLEVTADDTAETGHDDSDLVPGKGYWVFANKAGTLVP